MSSFPIHLPQGCPDPSTVGEVKGGRRKIKKRRGWTYQDRGGGDKKKGRGGRSIKIPYSSDWCYREYEQVLVSTVEFTYKESVCNKFWPITNWGKLPHKINNLFNNYTT